MTTETKKVEDVKHIAFNPATDIYEDENRVTLILDMPGVTADTIDISYEDAVLTLTGEHKQQAPEGYQSADDQQVVRVYKRSFEIDNDIDVESISADYKDGTLTLTLPKSEKQKKRTIEVKAS